MKRVYVCLLVASTITANVFCTEEKVENIECKESKVVETSDTKKKKESKAYRKISGGVKATFVFTKETYQKLIKIYASRLTKGEKISRSAIVCEAVELLYKLEDLQDWAIVQSLPAK